MAGGEGGKSAAGGGSGGVDDTLAAPGSDVEATLAAPGSGVEATLAAPGSGVDATLAAPSTPPARQPDVPDLVPVEPSYYVIGAEIARGGMGRILAARDRRLGRAVALKTLLDGDPGLMARFEREARITARLQHPAIVPIHEAGKLAGESFYAMKLVNGRALDKVIAEARTLAERLALLPRVIDVVEALAYAHSQRVIHRDLKPQNILVGAFGETVVIDWGLAKDLADRTEAPQLSVGPYRAADAGAGETTAGAIMGTPAYMPPEQANGEAVDERADVYALGALLYHVLAGAAPYRGTSTAEVLAAVVDGPPPPLAERAPGVPPELVSLVTKAMARDAAARPTSDELARQLRQFQTGKLVAAHQYSMGELVRRWLRRHRAVVSVAAAALLVLAVGGGVSMRRIVHERDRADAERRVAERERATSDQQKQEAERQRRAADELALELLVEQGRQELAAGHDRRAAVYLTRAWESTAAPPPTLRLMLREALRGIDAERTLLPGAPANGAKVAGRMTLVAFAPDGKLLTSGAADSAELWEPSTGARLRSFALAGDRYVGPNEVAFDPAGEFVVIGARVFDLRTGAKLVDLPGEPKPPGAGCLLSDDGTRIALVEGVATGLVAETRTGRVLRRVEGEELLRVDVACLSPDGTQLTVSGQYERPDIGWEGGGVYDVASGRRVSADHGGGFLARTPDRSTALLADGRDFVVVVSGHHVALDGAGVADAVAGFSADGALVAISGKDGIVHVWDARRGQRLADLSGHGVTVNAVAVDPQGRFVASAGDDNVVRVWDIAALRPFPLSPDATVGAVSADGALLAIQLTDDSHAPEILDSRTGALRARLDFTAKDVSEELDVPEDERPLFETIAPVAFLAGDTLLTRGTRGAQLWDSATGKLRRSIGAAEQVTAADDGRRFATLSKDGDVTIWSAAGEPGAHAALPPDGKAGKIERLRFSPDGALLALATDAGVIVYDAASGAVRWSHLGDERFASFPRPFFWSETGARLVTPAGVHNVTGALVVATRADAARIQSLTRDGARTLGVIVGTDRRTWEVRDVASGALQYVLPLDSPVAFAFAGDGAVLASLEDDTISLWELAHGRLLATRSAAGFVVSNDPDDPAESRLWARGPDGALAPFELPLEDRPAATLTDLVARRAGWRLADGVLVPERVRP